MLQVLFVSLRKNSHIKNNRRRKEKLMEKFKKIMVGMAAFTLLFSTVAPSMTGLVQANDIQVNSQQSEALDLLEQIDFDDAALAFFETKGSGVAGKSNSSTIGSSGFRATHGGAKLRRLVAAFSRHAQSFNCSRFWLVTN